MIANKTVAMGALALLVALPAAADRYFKSHTWQEGDEASDQAAITVEGYVDGSRADIRFIESGNPLMPKGSRLVAKDDLRELYLVDDSERTVQPFDLDAVLQMANSIMQGMGPLLKLKVENVAVETLLTEPGGQILGYDTTHHRFRTSYDITVKVMGMGQTQHVETVQDIWSTTQIEDPAMGVWLVRDPPDFGDEGFAQLLAAERDKMKGYPLKTVVEEVAAGKKKGKNERRTRTITEVQALDERPAPAGAYTWPDDYAMQPGLTAEQMAAEEEAAEEEEPEGKGWRSRLPFGKKKGGG